MFDITSVTADASDTIVSVEWTYTTDDGSLGGTHKLAMPAGSTPLVSVTEATVTSWLEEQLQNTAEEFDAAIAKRKQEAAYDETLVSYVNDGSGAFQVTEEPVEPVEPVAY